MVDRTAAMTAAAESAVELDERARGRLRDKVVVVTGAGQGIGRATARRLAAEGARVAVVDRSEAGATRVTDELVAAGADAWRHVIDLSVYADVEALFARVAEDHGRIDGLVNNVGGATALRPFADWEPGEIDQEIRRSLLPTVWCCRAVVPHMREQRSGRIVNVGAESVRNGLWDRAPYNVAKGGVHALTTSLARELAGEGITCNCVAPAATDTNVDRIAPRVPIPDDPVERAYREDLRARMLATIPLGRPATAEEQAAAVAFLVSDDASFVTGQVLSVNGGSSMV